MLKNLRVTVNGTVYDVQVEELGTAAAPEVISAAPAPQPVKPVQSAKPVAAAPTVVGAEKLVAPMPGNILGVNVKAGDSVKAGTVLMILEAMKMENEIMAPRDLVVAAVHVNKGDKVESGAPLVSFN